MHCANFLHYRTLIVLASLAVTGCATHAKNPSDPLEPLNRGIYKFNDVADQAIIKPVAKGYKAVVPNAGRIMITNFFSNLDDVVVTVNDLLQFKFRQGFSDGMRVFVNSTIGVFGLIDVASMDGLPKHKEDFGVTLGKWGVGNGPYLVVPILGPSTLRDSIGDYADAFPDPIFQVQDVPTRYQVYITKKVNRRSELLDQETILNEAMVDPYEFMRDAYLLRRQSKVDEDQPPRRSRYDDDEGSDTAPPANSPPQPASAPAPSATMAPPDSSGQSAPQPAAGKP
ncbi:MAG: VacJ family lipoprotein [Nitrosomonadales bacterium]|nr:VacJ family lipoprotein [Nitrosomonadales bacterium]